MGASRSIAAALATVLLGACADEPTAEEKAAADARDIAHVEAVQKMLPPVVPVAPQPILFPDIERYNLFGAGCAFVPEGGGLGAIVLTQPEKAYLKLEDELVTLASDPGSTAMPLGTWTRYAGKAFSVSLTRRGEGAPDREETVRWKGRLVIADPHDRTVYAADGAVQCGS